MQPLHDGGLYRLYMWHRGEWRLDFMAIGWPALLKRVRELRRAFPDKPLRAKAGWQ